jgi:hypothetical protein
MKRHFLVCAKTLEQLQCLFLHHNLRLVIISHVNTFFFVQLVFVNVAHE